MRASLVIGVVACLCFSVGEGLRLTPLPTAPLVEPGASDLQPYFTTPRGNPLHLTGPLDKPAPGHVQQRSKRQTQVCDCPPSGSGGEIPFHLYWHSGGGGHVAKASRSPAGRPPGRAPPPIS